MMMTPMSRSSASLPRQARSDARPLQQRRPARCATTVCCAQPQQQQPQPQQQLQQQGHKQQTTLSRRASVLGWCAAAVAASTAAAPAPAAAAEISVESDEPGFGQHAVTTGDLVLVHYTGTLADSGAVFDSTLGGGLKYRDGGAGVLRPAAFRLSGYATPGVCEGLQAALLGMKIGGRRTVVVPPELGFGDKSATLAPFAVVPPGATLRYEVQLLRVSSVGPDMLMKGISRCSAGGASAAADNCAAIEPAEFF